MNENFRILEISFLSVHTLNNDCECLFGYEGDGFECANIDECTYGGHDCGWNSICTDTDGSWTCHCEEGFEEKWIVDGVEA